MREILVKKDAIDKTGYTITKGTRILIKEELLNPMTKKKEYIILIDNGTGIKRLYPKTVIEAEMIE